MFGLIILITIEEKTMFLPKYLLGLFKFFPLLLGTLLYTGDQTIQILGACI